MSLVVITCECGGSENLVRQALHRYGYKNWAMEPIVKGKSKSLAEVEALIRKFPDSTILKALFAHINNNSKWCVILGYDYNGNSKWSDISHNDMKSDVEAESIVENFA